MPHFRGLSCFVVPLLLLAICRDGHCNPAEPQATFSLKDGWVEFALRKDGRPVANATILIMDERGVKFGEGETGEEGQAAFPLPRGSSFVVEIKAGDRTADPIRLFKSEAGIEPARVLLSYGLRPCCRSIKSRGEAMIVGEQIETPPVPNEDPPPWHLLAPALAGVLIAGVVLSVLWRRYRSALGTASRN
jgi:hypothetical protein